MARKRTATDDDEDQPDAATEGTDTAPENDGGGDAGDSGLEGRIREIVREVVGPLLDTGNGRSGRTPDEEDVTTRRVRAALDELRSNEEKETRLKGVEETLQKVTERPPSRPGILGKIQRGMWGDDE